MVSGDCNLSVACIGAGELGLSLPKSTFSIDGRFLALAVCRSIKRKKKTSEFKISWKFFRIF